MVTGSSSQFDLPIRGTPVVGGPHQGAKPFFLPFPLCRRTNYGTQWHIFISMTDHTPTYIHHVHTEPSPFQAAPLHKPTSASSSRPPTPARLLLHRTSAPAQQQAPQCAASSHPCSGPAMPSTTTAACQPFPASSSSPSSTHLGRYFDLLRRAPVAAPSPLQPSPHLTSTAHSLPLRHRNPSLSRPATTTWPLSDPGRVRQCRCFHE